jgi:hypothetical protein
MTCGKEKLTTDFYVRNKVNMVRHSECKICTSERVKKRHKENPERTRNNDLKRNYGITLNEHTQMYEEQNGVCAVCEKPGDGRWKKLCVDHDHKTGKVRQLLCRNCNMILGQVDDDANHLRKLTAYLQKHSE